MAGIESGACCKQSNELASELQLLSDCSYLLDRTGVLARLWSVSPFLSYFDETQDFWAVLRLCRTNSEAVQGARTWHNVSTKQQGGRSLPTRKLECCWASARGSSSLFTISKGCMWLDKRKGKKMPVLPPSSSPSFPLLSPCPSQRWGCSFHSLLLPSILPTLLGISHAAVFIGWVTMGPASQSPQPPLISFTFNKLLSKKGEGHGEMDAPD